MSHVDRRRTLLYVGGLRSAGQGAHRECFLHAAGPHYKTPTGLFDPHYARMKPFEPGFRIGSGMTKCVRAFGSSGMTKHVQALPEVLR